MGTKGKRILVFSPRFPFPLTEGMRIRVYHFCRLLSQAHEVSLLSLNEGPLVPDAVPKVKSIFKEVTAFPFHPLRFKLNVLRGFVSSDSLQPHYYYFGKVQKWLNHNVRDFDLIFCFHIRTVRYLERLHGCAELPKVIDFIDATSINYSEAQERARGIWRFVLPIENRRALRYELKALGLFDKAFITSPYDKQYLEEHAGRTLNDLVVLPNGVRDDLFERPTAEEERDWLVFLGKMDYMPNVDAVLYFAEEVYPLVFKREPEVEFVIVGISPAREVLALQHQPGIKVTGFVEDPYEYLERAKVVVAPLRFSAGIQNKVLEAMALGKAVVTTSKAARGIEGKDGKHFVVADTEKEMAEKILELLADDSKRREIGENARELVEKKYRWDIVGRKLLKEIEEVLNH